MLSLEVVKHHLERSYIDNHVSSNSKLQYRLPGLASTFDKTLCPGAKNWTLKFPGVQEAEHRVGARPGDFSN